MSRCWVQSAAQLSKRLLASRPIDRQTRWQDRRRRQNTPHTTLSCYLQRPAQTSDVAQLLDENLTLSKLTILIATALNNNPTIRSATTTVVRVHSSRYGSQWAHLILASSIGARLLARGANGLSARLYRNNYIIRQNRGREKVRSLFQSLKASALSIATICLISPLR